MFGPGLAHVSVCVCVGVFVCVRVSFEGLLLLLSRKGESERKPPVLEGFSDLG